MRGYVVKKGKSYYAVVYDGVDPGTGKEKRKWVSAGPRRSDAEKLVTDLVKRRNQGVSVATEKLTLGEYLTGRWLPIQESQIAVDKLRRLALDGFVARSRWLCSPSASARRSACSACAYCASS